MRKNLLFIHQSGELYGSDRVLLALVSKLDRKRFHPIVLLPVDGPLRVELHVAGVECHVLPITLLSRATLSLPGLLNLPVKLLQSLRAINRVLHERQVDVVHSNTLAVLSGPLWARWHGVPHVWHVHEIIVKPQFVRWVYAWMLSCFADCIICVSNATKANLLQDKPSLAKKIRVVWNGLERGALVDKDAVRSYREQFKVLDGDVLVALVGRINRWKGQRVLVEAASLLWQQGVRNIKFLIVGSTPDGQVHFLNELQQSIARSPARQLLALQGFTSSVWGVWDACDVAVIPSTEPEPFGMVALEAMASAKPVVATNHGGLAEIVVEGETGLLVLPGDAHALAHAIKMLADDATLRMKMGEAGLLRYHNKFTLDRYVENMTKVYERLLGDLG